MGSIQPPKDSRATTSCTECQRRKQKCSREWPCNHCQLRKVPHLCQFGPKKSQSDSPSESARGQKRSLIESDKGVSLVGGDFDDVDGDGLKAWGYMPGHAVYNIGSVDSEGSATSATSTSTQSDEVNAVLHIIPPRSITDLLVNHFLYGVNSRYNSVYAPSFTNNYVKWWSDRINGKRLSPEFTCLILRVCAYSSQYLTQQLREHLKNEMATEPDLLGERFHLAAEQLSATFTPANRCLERVQELFLKGVWLKSAGLIVESWHTLSTAIREAQELGYDRNVGLEDLSEFDVELRRRLWCLLYVWDWQMSSWLGRPHLIDQKDCSFVFPSLKLEENKALPNLVSPFAHMAIQAQLGRRIALRLGNATSVTPELALAIQDVCEEWIRELPAVFLLDNPDTSLDKDHPHLIFQRCQLHCITYMTMMDPFKSFMTRTPDPSAPYDVRFRALGMDLGLKLLRASRRLFDHEFPINAKFHLVIFSAFDTATILCSAMIHDVDGTLPKRNEVMDAVKDALDMLEQLSKMTKIGASSYKFLFKLSQAIPFLSRRPHDTKRQKTTNVTVRPEVPQLYTDINSDHLFQPRQPGAASAPQPVVDLLAPPQHMPFTDDMSFDLDQFLQENVLDNSTQLNIGGLEQVWDWDALHLNQYLEPDQI